MRSHIKTTLALALALGAVAPAAASAAFIQGDPPANSYNPPPVQIVRLSAPSGFEWGDAGIGAAGGFALSMVGLGGALAASQRRTRQGAPLTR